MSASALRRLPRLSAEAGGAGGQDRRTGISARSPNSRCARRVDWFAASAAKSSTPSATRSPAASCKEIGDRLTFLVDVGLDYLTLSRASGTLSGGESQRIRLASQIGSGLTGVLYVLDEPSIGLHQRDNARLLDTLRRLRDLGNTVIVVEHDEDAILTADYVVDVGPGRRHPWRRDRRARNARPRSWPIRTRSPAQYLTGRKQVRFAARAPQAGRRRAS